MTDSTGLPSHSPWPEDAGFMALALQEAEQAARNGEVPIGAVLVQGGRVVAKAHNAPIALCDPTAHAEVLALRAGARYLANYRLSDCTLYVTAEPCAMCAGAIVHARLSRVVYAVNEPRTGAAGSQIDVFANPSINAHTRVTRGVLADEARTQLQAFFAQQRARQKKERLPLRDDAVRLSSKAETALMALQSESHAQDKATAGDWQSSWHWFAAPTDAPDNALGAGVPESFVDERGAPNRSSPARTAGQGDACHKISTSAHLPWRLHAWTLSAAPNKGAHAAAVAMVHGWGQHAGVWRHWAQAARHAGWQVVLPDLLGHGLSDKPKRAGTDAMRLMLQALLAQLQASVWAQAGERMVVLDAHLLPVLARHAKALGLDADVWRGVHWRWVQRPAQGVGGALGAFALKKLWSAGFPAQVASLRKLLAGNAAELAAWDAAWPDAGHVSLLREWLAQWPVWDGGQALRAGGSMPDGWSTGACVDVDVSQQDQILNVSQASRLEMLSPSCGFAAAAHQWLHPRHGWQPGWPTRVAPMRCGADLPALAQAMPLPNTWPWG